jgi:hypothetical protein
MLFITISGMISFFLEWFRELLWRFDEASDECDGDPAPKK